MAIVNGYVSLGLLKSVLSITDTADDAIAESSIETVSRAIDDFTGRTFAVETGVRYATASKGRVRVPGRDILSITALKTSPASDRVYSDTWAVTDYDLMPFDAAGNGLPFEEIVTRSGGAHSFPSYVQGVEVTGTFGYSGATEDTTATLGEALDSSETGVDVSSGLLFAVGDRILVESEQMLVTGIATNTLTVRRGINGTTAAAHDTALTVRRYVVPAQVRQACLMEAERHFKLIKEAPFGIAGSPEFGTQTAAYKWHPVAKALLMPFKRWAVA